MAAHHELMGGKLHVYKRENSSYWQCSTFLGGKNHRVSTKEESLAQAKDFAEDWYLELKGKFKRGEVKAGKTFKFAAAKFIDEFEVITQGQRSPIYVAHHRRRLDNYLVPFFGNKALAEITAGLAQDYRMHRMKNGWRGKAHIFIGAQPRNPQRTRIALAGTTLILFSLAYSIEPPKLETGYADVAKSVDATDLDQS